MSNSSISKRDKLNKLNELLGGLQNLYKDDLKNVVYLCYDLGASYEQVGSALGVSKQAVSQQFPKEKKA